MTDTPELHPMGKGEASPLLIDDIMPNRHASRVEMLVVEADPGPTYAALRELDFMSVHSPLMDAATWARRLPERIAVATGRREPTPAPRAMRLSEMFDRAPGERPPDDAMAMWMPLGEDPGRELVFGAVGRFWQPDIEWKQIEPHMFRAFGEPGWGKIAANLCVMPFGVERSIASYEARTVMTDEASRAKFMRYWRAASPFVGTVLRSVLKSAKREVESQPPGAPSD
ncbi:MAG TPA: hypothetical protein VFZ68_01140 [Acidimicrobiales bacterium]